MTLGRSELNKPRLVLLVALFFALMGASIFRTPPIVFMAAVLCCAPPIAALLSFFARRHLRISRAFPEVGSVGDLVTAHVTLSNTGWWPIFLVHSGLIPSTVNKIPAAGPLELLSEAEHIEPALAPRATLKWEEKWLLHRRGLLEVPPIGAGAIDPLGFSARLDSVSSAQHILVLPRVLKLARLGWTGGSWGMLRPPLQAAHVAEASDFHGIRAHRPGEGLRRVHWKSTARTGQLHVVEWEEEMACDLTLLLDVRAAIHAGPPGDDSLEVLVIMAAAIAAFLLQNGHRFGMMWLEDAPSTPSAASSPPQLRRLEARNLGALNTVLRALAQLKPCFATEATLADLTAQSAPNLPSDTGILLISTDRAELSTGWLPRGASKSSAQRVAREANGRSGQSLIIEADSFASADSVPLVASASPGQKRATRATDGTSNQRVTGFSAASASDSMREKSAAPRSPAPRRVRRGDSLIAILERGA